MGRRGIRPQPTVLKIATGLGGRREKASKSEPVAAPGMPDRPELPDDMAIREWNRLCKLLDDMGLLTVDTGDILRRYVEADYRFRKANEAIAKHGDYYHSETGLRRHPGFGTIAQCDSMMVRCLCEMGLTPSARTGVKSIKPITDEGDLESFAKRKSG